MTQILIVGAGVAGMAAAEHLTAAGYAPKLVDKAARPGGRCATRRIAAELDADWFDYGAQYFTVRDEGFRALVDADLQAGRLAHWSPAIASAERVAGTWLLTPSPDDRERLIGPRGLNAWVRQRLQAARLEVATERQVQRIVAEGGRWRIDYADGSAEWADVVVCTPPAVQTAALLGPRAVGIDALAHPEAALAACHSVVVRGPALPERQAIFFKSGRLSWVADNTHKAGRSGDRHLWTLHADAQFSESHIETPTAELADALISEFATATAQRASDMEIVRTHRWRYARPGPGAPDADELCWADTDSGLAIAGDWLAGGRIEGAWLSGREAARRLIAAYALGHSPGRDKPGSSRPG
ncbi:NAD(P)/FAD-dependent oxidoreductase [Salinisphaera sp. LB1]|uniref:NAD(P)/FAD-dependent oxidoreductase n=1 Tax=Salinisphaera sp. LB1 TaxID=2183911 RepID=UPI000D7E9C0F|nr:FAD-dependent oxidoreductase [Salinisphaera sp. LB1]AWN15226.1 Amine oxidase, flavin-containing [Salinisphaera sp. LB1]